MKQIGSGAQDVEVMTESTVTEDFAQARQFKEMARLSACQATAFVVLTGFELIRLHKTHGVRRGGDHTSEQSRSRSVLLWGDIVKRELGVTTDTASNWMKMAAECEKRLPQLADIKLLLDTPLKDLPELKRVRITDGVKSLTDGASAKQLMLDWGITRPPQKQKYTAPRKLSPEEQIEEENEAARMLKDDLIHNLRCFQQIDPRAHLSEDERKELLGVCIDFNHWLRQAVAARPASAAKTPSRAMLSAPQPRM